MEDERQDGILGSGGGNSEIMIFLGGKLILTHGRDSDGLGVLDDDVGGSPSDRMTSAGESRRSVGAGLTSQGYTDLPGDEERPWKSSS